MDMWKPFKIAANTLIPQADIVYDKFHITKYLNKGLDDTRKDEVKKHVELKNSKYIFLKNSEKWNRNQLVKFESINRANLATSKAWQLKENFKGFYLQYSRKECLIYFERWYINTIKSGLKHMIKVADTLLKHLKGITAAAVTGFTNSIAENLNSQIQVVKTVGRGFANPNAYRNAILFFQGKLNLMPL
jgi:transposase